MYKQIICMYVYIKYMYIHMYKYVEYVVYNIINIAYYCIN